MRTFSDIKNKLQKYQDEIILLKESIIEHNIMLKKEILDYWYETKFLTIKLNDGSREYYYLSSFNLTDADYFYGVKVTKGKELEIGKISFNSILSAVKYETINPDRFFGKLKSLDINTDGYNNPIITELNAFKPVVIHTYDDKKKVVGYCRLSQNNRCKNLFDRQQSLIRNFVNENSEYHLLEFFSEIAQGSISLNKRQIVSDLIDYCSCNDVHTIVISELNRLGRTKNVILSAISFLNKHGINEIYTIKENILINEEYVANNYRQLNSLAKSCEDEYENIIYRMREGSKAYVEKRREAIKNGDNDIPRLGRQGYVKNKDAYLKQYGKEIDLLFKSEMSLRQVRTITGTSLGTLQKIKKMFKGDYIVN